jgi:SAM-dependent methyltransferase
LDADQCRTLVQDTLLGPVFCRATFGGTIHHNRSCPWVKVVVRPVELRGERHLQFAWFDGRKTLTRNYLPQETLVPLEELLAVGFASVHLSTRGEEIDIRLTRKGRLLLGRRAGNNPIAAPDTGNAHNRIKEVPLPEGRADSLLEAMGIVTREGRVRPTMRPKYTQINEFLKHLVHVLEDAGLAAPGRVVEILDCGCGSSYLTLAVHHYLNDVLQIPARILGVDVNDEVIRKSVTRADRLGTEGISFTCARIGAVDIRADIVLALHACDTATDEALAQAVRSEARLILSVPCCHHNLNRTLRPRGQTEVLRPLFRHGILRERMADLVTDAFRALALRILGYRTEVVEFVSLEHTARNVMIRAVRGPSLGVASLIAEYREMRQFFGVTPAIERMLGESFQQLVNTDPTA